MKNRPLRSPMSMISGSSMPISMPRQLLIEGLQLGSRTAAAPHVGSDTAAALDHDQSRTPRSRRPSRVVDHDRYRTPQQLGFTVDDHPSDTASTERRCTFGGSSDPGPIQLAQRKLPGSVFVQLVRDGVHRPSRGMDMDVGQPEQPLQRALLERTD